MQYKKQHPIKILGYTTKNFWLLSIPLLRGLFYLQFDLQAWLEGAWFDLLILFLILCFAFIRWLSVSYAFSDNEFHTKSGLIFFAHSSIHFSTITYVEIERSMLLKPFKASVLFLDTYSGGVKKSDKRLTLKNKDIDAFVENYSKLNNSDQIRKSYYPSRKNLVFFSLIFSNTLSGVILVATLFIQGSKLIGQALENRVFSTINTLSQDVVKILSPTALGISLIIVVGWLFSFVINLLRHWNFNCNRKGENILIQNGYFTTHNHILRESKINYVDLRQSLLTILFHISSVHIHCTGYGKTKNAIAVLVPITFKREVINTMKMLLPNFHTSDIKLHPRKKQLSRFMFPPICALAILVLLMLFFLSIAPTWKSMILFVFYIALAPLIWLLIVKIIACFHTGLGFADGFITAKYCRFFAYRSIIVPVDKIVMVQVRQTKNQRRTKNCNLVLLTIAEKPILHKVKNMPLKETMEFLRRNDIHIL